MRETIYNIFYILEDDIIVSTAICRHEMNGSDTEKLEWLKSQVNSDWASSKTTNKIHPISYSRYQALARLGRHLEIFEPLFESIHAPANPLCCVTAIVDNSPRIDFITDHSPLTAATMQSSDSPILNVPRDWLIEYTTDQGFDFPSLINDDYFHAIRLLYNEKQYVSCMKLLLSFIDTISFLALGDEPSVFVKWMNTHSDLTSLKITSEELWEMRNALLHMSNLDSRKIVQKRVRRINFCIATRGRCARPDSEVTYFNLLDLIGVVADALSRWIKHINNHRDEFVGFVERYDRIISDARVTHVAHDS